jgi:hypothetical protein
MVKQAQSYPNEGQRKIYLDAAARFRLPYWDLIMPRNEQTVAPPGKKPDPRTIWGCPAIFKAEEVFVKLPKDDPKKDEKGFSKIANPLASFIFPKDQDWAQHTERKILQMEERWVTHEATKMPD